MSSDIEKDVQSLNDIANRLRKMGIKVQLIGLLSKAKSEYDKYEYEDARDTLIKVLEKSPNNVTALRGLGCVCHSQGDSDGAISYFTKALELSEKKEVEYTLLGTVYYWLNDFEHAISYFEKAIAENSEYDLAYDGRNQSMLEYHLRISDLQEALKKYF